jgi:predicted nucleic acid-binding protein
VILHPLNTSGTEAMKRYLLDTSILAAYLHNRKLAVTLLTPLMKSHHVATSILVYAEVTEYIQGLSSYHQRANQLRQLLKEIYPYFFTYSILERYAEIRRTLRPPHGKGLIGDIDTLIAATALERNLTIIIADHDFERVPRLKVQFVDLKTA